MDLVQPTGFTRTTDSCRCGGDLAAAIAVGIFNLARQRIAASLRSDPHDAAVQQAIQAALRDALVRTVAGLTDNREHFEHLLHTVFAPWLGRPAVQVELQKVLAAGPEARLDMARLEAEFVALDFERDALPAPLADVVYQLASAFGAAAVWQGELQSVALTNSVARIEAQLRALSPLDLDVTLREHYLNGVLSDCDRVLLMDSDTEEGRRPPRLQRVFVDLRIDQQPTLDQFFFRLGIEPWQDELARKVLQNWLDRHKAERNRRMMWRETQQDGENWLEHLRSLDEEETGKLAQALAVQPDELTAAVQPLTPLEALLAQSRPQMVLLGDPGSGKSTITRRIAAVLAALGHSDAAAQLDADEQAWAHQLLSRFGRWLLPVRVVMSRWAQEHKNSSGCAADVIAECIRIVSETTPAAPQRLAETINERFNGRQPTIFVLLDGLDEVTDEAKSWALLDAVADFHTKYPRAPLLITCRSRPYAALQARAKTEGRRWPNLPLRTLLPLQRAAIDRFLDRWHAEMADARHYERVEAGHARAKIATELDRPERRELRKMAETPLLLTMMVIVNYKQRLPDSRIELYEQLVRQLLYEWERTKQEIRGQKTSLERYLQEADAKVDELGEQLNQLAFTIHDPAAGAEGGDTVDIPLARLADALRPLYPEPSNASQRAEAEAWLADVLTLITGRSGLLNEVDKGIFRFTHRTFQEYLAARWIAAGMEEISDGDGETKADYIDYRVIAEHVDDSNWREAILLTIGYQSLLQTNAYDRTANILHGLWPDDPLSQPQRALLLGEAFVHLFGAKRLGKVKNKRIAAELARRVPRDLKVIMQSPAPPARIRLEAGLLLADLGVLPDGLDEFVEPFPNAGFLIARYPVTNHQFKRFVDAGGYGEKAGPRPAWWSEQGWDYRNVFDWSEPRGWDDAPFNRPTRPVVGVSWYEAEAYCNWLNGPGSHYKPAEGSAQLPSVAQWEAAARSGRSAPGNKQQEERDYPWADVFDPALANTGESNLRQTTPVDMYLDGRTEAGVFDLAGNVWEWTSEMERRGRYFIKGGSWAEGAEKARAGLRSALSRWNFWNSGGFRAVVVPILSCAPSGC